jgi:hypothetical protein
MGSYLRHIPLAAACLSAAACAFTAAPARAAAICGEGMYAYAGFDGNAATRGVSATIEQAGPLHVRNGHVAGWAGIVSPDVHGWLQVGLSAMPNDTTSAIYYEFALPGHAPVYRIVRRHIDAGQPHRVAVLEQPRKPGWWVVWVDGVPASAPMFLAGSHGRWTAQVLGESWAGSTSGTCNGYSYAFNGVSLLGAPRVDRVADANYAVWRSSPTSFVAMSVNNPVTSS